MTLKAGYHTASYHSSKFGGHRYCRNADNSFLNLLRDNVIKRSRDFDGGVHPLQGSTLPSLGDIGIVEGQI